MSEKSIALRQRLDRKINSLEAERFRLRRELGKVKTLRWYLMSAKERDDEGMPEEEFRILLTTAEVARLLEQFGKDTSRAF